MRAGRWRTAGRRRRRTRCRRAAPHRGCRPMPGRCRRAPSGRARHARSRAGRVAARRSGIGGWRSQRAAPGSVVPVAARDEPEPAVPPCLPPPTGGDHSTCTSDHGLDPSGSTGRTVDPLFFRRLGGDGLVDADQFRIRCSAPSSHEGSFGVGDVGEAELLRRLELADRPRLDWSGEPAEHDRGPDVADVGRGSRVAGAAARARRRCRRRRRRADGTVRRCRHPAACRRPTAAVTARRPRPAGTRSHSASSWRAAARSRSRWSMRKCSS